MSGIKYILMFAYSKIPLQVRLGANFFKQLEFLKKSQWWSKQELENYQNEQLRNLIKHAYENVPYYHNLFIRHRLRPEDIKTIHDLCKLPVLTKDNVRNYLNQLRAANLKTRDIIKLSTSGTTGKPLMFYYNRNNEYLNHDPFVWRFFSWAGHKPEDIRANLTSWIMQKNDYYRYNPIRNLLILSGYKLNRENAKIYAEALRRYNVKYIEAYPSAIENLVRFLKEQNIDRPVALEAIFTRSEYLNDWQRNMIESYWECKCFDWYGMEERVIMGCECEKHEGLHLCSDFGVTEFLDDSAYGHKKIIATSLVNYAMPFIRYDTEDLGALLNKKCSCNRVFPLFNLSGGRKRNFALAKDNSYISMVNIDIPSVSDNVFQFQFMQEHKGRLILCIVKRNTFTQKDLTNIQKKLDDKFGSNMDIAINFTDAIKQNGRKTSLFIQKLEFLNKDE